MTYPFPRYTIYVIFIYLFCFCQKEKQEESKESHHRSTQITEAKLPSIIFLGDSLTAGYGLKREESLPALIQKKIDTANIRYRVINAGRSGDTTAGGLGRLNWYLRPELKHIIIGLGSNDTMQGFSIKSIKKNLLMIIGKIRDFDANIKIYIWQMHTFPNLGKKYAKEYSDLFPALSRSEKVIMLPFPLKGVASNPKLNQADAIHPNAQGMKIIAENIWKTLQPHL